MSEITDEEIEAAIRRTEEFHRWFGYGDGGGLTGKIAREALRARKAEREMRALLREVYSGGVMSTAFYERIGDAIRAHESEGKG